MPQGKYQVRANHKASLGRPYQVYNILDNEVIASFTSESQAQKYADKLNGIE